MHILQDNVYLEVNSLDCSNNASTGRALVTGLINTVMPLIRYEIGDILTINKSESNCECHNTNNELQIIHGRTINSIDTSELKLNSYYLEDTLYGMFKNITKLIMLKENHIQGLEQTIQLEYDIVLYDNILQAIHDADLILLIYDEIYSIFLKEKIAQLNVCNKKAIFLCYNRKQNKFISNVDNFRDIPTILLLEHGEYAQIEKAEFAINQALNK